MTYIWELCKTIQESASSTNLEVEIVLADMGKNDQVLKIVEIVEMRDNVVRVRCVPKPSDLVGLDQCKAGDVINCPLNGNDYMILMNGGFTKGRHNVYNLTSKELCELDRERYVRILGKAGAV